MLLLLLCAVANQMNILLIRHWSILDTETNTTHEHWQKKNSNRRHFSCAKLPTALILTQYMYTSSETEKERERETTVANIIIIIINKVEIIYGHCATQW